MYGTDLLVSEHENIKRMLVVLDNASLQVLGGNSPNLTDFRQMIAFIRLYADKTHHGKEEAYLFQEMEGELGALATKLVRNGMLVEHDLGRLYVSELEAALADYEKCASERARLDILVAAGSYVRLLTRHIEKENTVVFPFGERSLSSEALERVENNSRTFEEDAENSKVREEQLEILTQLEEKY